MAKQKRKASSLIDGFKLAEKLIPNAQEVINSTDTIFQAELERLNNEIKVRHEWGKNRTFNLRSQQYLKRIKFFTYMIGNDASYASPLYYGSKPHKIEARRKKSLSWVSGGTRFFAKSVWHPGITARPWIEKVWDRRKRGIIKKLADNIEKFFAFQ